MNFPHDKNSNSPVIVITGGTQGLGRALAETLLQGGFRVSFCARSSVDVEAAKAALQSISPVVAVSGDINDDTVQTRLVDETVRAFGRIDGVVNNASTLGSLPLPVILQSSFENDRHVFATNVLAPLQLLRKAVPILTRQSRSLILGISSDAAAGGYPGWGIYGASKAALDLLHKTMAAELAADGVQVHSVDPGDMDTTMHHAADPGAQGLASPATVARALLPLFMPLLDSRSHPFATGTRLRVAGGVLEGADLA